MTISDPVAAYGVGVPSGASSPDNADGIEPAILALDPAVRSVLGSATKLAIVQALQLRPAQTTADLADAIGGGLSPHTINSHLRQLQELGWVHVESTVQRRGGHQAFWSTNPDRYVPWRMQIKWLNRFVNPDAL